MKNRASISGRHKVSHLLHPIDVCDCCSNQLLFCFLPSLSVPVASTFLLTVLDSCLFPCFFFFFIKKKEKIQRYNTSRNSNKLSLQSACASSFTTFVFISTISSSCFSLWSSRPRLPLPGSRLPSLPPVSSLFPLSHPRLPLPYCLTNYPCSLSLPHPSFCFSIPYPLSFSWFLSFSFSFSIISSLRSPSLCDLRNL